MDETIESPDPTEKNEINLCDYVRSNGTFCQSPAITGDTLCYYHKRDRDRQKRILNNLDKRRSDIAEKYFSTVSLALPGNPVPFDDRSAELFSGLQLPALEDANAIQVCLTDLYRAIATQQVNMLVAGRLLYTLQIAALNLNRTSFSQPVGPEAQTIEDDSPIEP